MATAHAQERSAGQSYDAQINWAALQSQIKTVIDQNKAIATTVDNVNGKLDAISACGKKNEIWNGTACVAVSSTPPVGKLVTQAFSFDSTGYNYCNVGQSYCISHGYDSQIDCTTTSTQVNCGHQICPPAVTAKLVCGKVFISN